jgi:hypothetical protein
VVLGSLQKNLGSLKHAFAQLFVLGWGWFRSDALKGVVI